MAKIPTLRQIQYFLAIADTLSFHQAAELCHVTQSTLSGGLSELESLLGEKLFERTSRSVTLTRVGSELVLPARDLAARAENFVALAGSHRAPLSGPLSLGVIPTIAPYLLPALLPKLQKKYGDLELHLREDLTGRLLDDLQRGNIDVALMAFPFDTPNAEQMILWREPFLMVRSESSPVTGKTLSLDDLKNETILLLDDGHCLRDHVIAACHLAPSAHGAGLRKTFGATSLQTLIQMVQHGYGATLLPAMALRNGAIPKGLKFQKFPVPPPSRGIGLAWRKGSPRAAEFQLLGEFIAKTCKP
jgi:LysR family hydrogen peroxide-inducible transcriptional activator